MATSSVTDEQLTGILAGYAGMVAHVVRDPQRWLGVDDDPPASASLPARVLDAVRDRAVGEVTPASEEWARQPAGRRVDWWVRRIGLTAGLAAAAPRFAGAIADRVPLQSALGASASGLAVCAAAREHGVTDPADWVPLLGTVLFGRDLVPAPDSVPATDAERALEEAAEDPTEPPSAMEALGDGAKRTVRTLWRLARSFLEVDDLLDRRPRGGIVTRTLARLPVVGVAGGWLDERTAIRTSAKRTTQLVATGAPQRR
ncbi:MAG TPA: hypothetical protein VES95_02445 [Dermatophilaceae bacterium]|nr:hypothetical protein [Dermatophilaceae bacterium]